MKKFSTATSSTDAVDEALRRFPNTPDDARVRRPVVRALFGGIADRTLTYWIEKGKVPPPVHGDPREGWLVGPLRQALRGEWKPKEVL